MTVRRHAWLVVLAGMVLAVFAGVAPAFGTEYFSDTEVWQSAVQFAHTIEGPVASPDGARLAWIDDDAVFTWTPSTGVTKLTGWVMNPKHVACSSSRVAWANEVLKPREITGQDGWHDYEIFTWSPASGVVKLTDTLQDEVDPAVSGDRVVWSGHAISTPAHPVAADWEIFTWTPGTGTTQVSDNVGRQDFAPSVSGDRIAWLSTSSYGGMTPDRFLPDANTEVFYWTPAMALSTLQITHNADAEADVTAFGDYVTWVGTGGSDGGGDTEVFTYRLGEGIRQLTADGDDASGLAAAGGRIAWSDGIDILTWTAASGVVRLTHDVDVPDHPWWNMQPAVSAGRVAWWRHGSADMSLFTWTAADGVSEVWPGSVTRTGFELLRNPAITGGRVCWLVYTGPATPSLDRDNGIHVASTAYRAAVSPSSVRFVDVDYNGGAVAKVVKVTNRSKKALSIRSITFSKARNGLSVTGPRLPVALGPGRSLAFTVRYEPHVLGSIASAVLVRTSIPGAAAMRVDVSANMVYWPVLTLEASDPWPARGGTFLLEGVLSDYGSSSPTLAVDSSPDGTAWSQMATVSTVLVGPGRRRAYSLPASATATTYYRARYAAHYSEKSAASPVIVVVPTAPPASYARDFPVTQPAGLHPLGLAIGSNDHIYLGGGDSYVAEYLRDGTFVGSFPAGGGSVSEGSGPGATWNVAASDSRIYAGYPSSVVGYGYGGASEITYTMSGGTDFHDVGGIAVDGAGNLYVAHTSAGGVVVAGTRSALLSDWRVSKFTPDGTYVCSFGDTGPDALQQATGIAVDPNGKVYVADPMAGAIRSYLITQTIVAAGVRPMAQTYALAGSWTTTAVPLPTYLACDAAGHVYVTDPAGARVVKLGSDGAVLDARTTRGAGAAELGYPTGIGVASDGHVFVADDFAPLRVHEFGPASLAASTITIARNKPVVARRASFQLSGALYPGGAHSPVDIYVRKPGAVAWTKLATVSAGQAVRNGVRWSYSCKLTVKGVHAFRARFAGDTTRLPCTSPLASVRAK